ncbi:MAG: hypothetical protein C5B47_08920 [Verrucomicrobia bacterium]|nr:MAG: hypothetical protein C5B47_08920 [Verrucomicrobiota bacterium]
MKPRAPAKLRLRRRRSPIQLKMASRRASTANAEEEDDHEDESNTMKLSHAFFVVLILHLVLIGGIFGFNYIKARQIPSLLRPQQTPAPQEDKRPVNSNTGTPKATASPAAKSSGVSGESIAAAASTSQRPQTSGISENPTSKLRIHRVAEGETLSRIAVAYGVTVAQIEKANGISQVSDGELLKIPPRNSSRSPSPSTPPQATSTAPQIRKLATLPAIHTSEKARLSDGKPMPKAARDSNRKHPHESGSTPTDHATHGAKGTAQKEGNQIIYTVVAGDNPYSIARRFRINYLKLLELNHIKDPTKLQIGTKLKIFLKKES